MAPYAAEAPVSSSKGDTPSIVLPPTIQDNAADTAGVPLDVGMKPFAEEAPVSSSTAETEAIVSPDLCLEPTQQDQATQQHPSPAVPGDDGPVLQEKTGDTPPVPEDDCIEALAEEAPFSSCVGDTPTIVLHPVPHDKSVDTAGVPVDVGL
jgi:hypothetical protein